MSIAAAYQLLMDQVEGAFAVGRTFRLVHAGRGHKNRAGSRRPSPSLVARRSKCQHAAKLARRITRAHAA